MRTGENAAVSLEILNALDTIPGIFKPAGKGKTVSSAYKAFDLLAKKPTCRNIVPTSMLQNMQKFNNMKNNIVNFYRVHRLKSPKAKMTALEKRVKEIVEKNKMDEKKKVEIVDLASSSSDDEEEDEQDEDEDAEEEDQEEEEEEEEQDREGDEEEDDEDESTKKKKKKKKKKTKKVTNANKPKNKKTKEGTSSEGREYATLTATLSVLLAESQKQFQQLILQQQLQQQQLQQQQQKGRKQQQKGGKGV
jgi:cobalamin biosynthesis protein CobT